MAQTVQMIISVLTFVVAMITMAVATGRWAGRTEAVKQLAHSPEDVLRRLAELEQTRAVEREVDLRFANNSDQHEQFHRRLMDLEHDDRR